MFFPPFHARSNRNSAFAQLRLGAAKASCQNSPVESIHHLVGKEQRVGALVLCRPIRNRFVLSQQPVPRLAERLACCSAQRPAAFVAFRQMNRVTLKELPLRGNGFSGWTAKIHRALFGLFLVQFALVWARLWLPVPPLGNARWPDGLLLVLTTATLVASLTRQLPGQNLMLAAVIIAFIAGALQSLGALTAIPFGPYVYTEQFGQQLFYPLPWAVPLVWITVIFASRGVARLTLRPWRKTSTYGFRLIGLTTALVVLLDLGLEPFATRVKHYWFWNPTKLKFDWYGAPGVNFFGWAVTTLLIVAFITPCLINKKPMPQPPPDYAPLVIWLLLNFLFATGAAVHHLWPALGLIGSYSVVLTAFALRGARNPLGVLE